MLRTKYYLTDGNAAGETAIYAACYLEGKRRKIYLPLTVLPGHWDTKAQKYRRNYPNHPETNVLLKLLSERLDAAALASASKGQLLTSEELREVVALTIGGPQADTPVGLLELLEQWIEASRRDKTESTVKSYRTLLNHLKAYAKLRRLRLEFSNVDTAFCEAFKNYLLGTVGIANTSVNNNVKYLKAFLNATFEQGMHEFAHFKRFRKLEDLQPEVVYLTRAEKTALATLNLDYLPRLEQTRDVFLFECETGLRFSDVQALRPEQIQNEFVLLTTLKTSDFLKVPLSPLVQTILRKYAGGSATHALPVKSNQKSNEDLKHIAQLARLTSLTTTTQLRGKVRKVTTRPKHELVCTHTARRTFVTLALEGGMRPKVVMRITGHKDYKSLHRYLKITDAVVQKEFGDYINGQDYLLEK
ncbi:integrase family protein [Hymenobacter roseosalivarius DSM 11622]|uniref:Integrase family protein n=1 Tax=Hymenobacter roseosalivarius DSM 11622 TaxID=645990 RepID=A0A1W1VGW2_9BACT|nr:site-specific integrase [Hymenobacter roseosalivarius]SMB92598.1 integrase family protein [Hymenobacter roseosalivarius DSM 11622]